MAEHGHLYPGLALVRPSASSFISRQASEPSAAQEAQYHVQAATGDADHPRPSSPPTYPTLQGHHGTRTVARWEDSEIHYSKYLMELLIPLKIMLAKFHVRFSDYRTSQYLQTQMKLLSQSRAGARAEASSAMKTRFGDNGSTQVFQTIAILESMDTSRLSSRTRILWTAEEHTFLQSLVPKCATWKEVYDGLEAEYPKGRSMATVRHCIAKQDIDISQLRSPKPWTLEEDNVLRRVFLFWSSSASVSHSFSGEVRLWAHP